MNPKITPFLRQALNKFISDKTLVRDFANQEWVIEKFTTVSDWRSLAATHDDSGWLDESTIAEMLDNGDLTLSTILLGVRNEINTERLVYTLGEGGIDLPLYNSVNA